MGVYFFYAVLAVIVAVMLFVGKMLRDYNLTRLVSSATEQARASHDKLRDCIVLARRDRSPKFDYDFGDKLLRAVTLCLDDADRKVARAPSHIKSYRAAWIDVKLALSQLGDVEKLFTYVANEG